jgi:hypothetical protein
VDKATQPACKNAKAKGSKHSKDAEGYFTQCGHAGTFLLAWLRRMRAQWAATAFALASWSADQPASGRLITSIAEPSVMRAVRMV